MTKNQEMSKQLETLLALKAPPVGLVFSEAPLPGVARVDGPAPAGCAYWKRAAKGDVFYTVGEDHLGCAIGAHTHGAELTADAKNNLMAMIGMMTDAGYIEASEIPAIAHRTSKLDFVTYGPLDRLPRDADVVLVRATPRSAMLLAEATHAAGVRSEHASVIRPACAMIPDVMKNGRAATSFGCIGNRVYTELPDDEVWSALDGPTLAATLAKLHTIVAANQKLESFHRARV